MPRLRIMIALPGWRNLWPGRSSWASRAVSGVEFSVQYEGELHILGYGVDLGHSRFARECRVLAQRRETRVQEMAEKLCQAGYRISLERIRAHAGGELIGRPHIAAALVEAGYARDIPDAFQRFLNRGGAGFVERYRLSEEEAICLIHEARGQGCLGAPKACPGAGFSRHAGSACGRGTGWHRGVLSHA